jgi:ACT domain-containing protein
MAVTVKKAILWRREVDNDPGMLANILQPLSEAGANLQVVMAYRDPGGENKATIELYPVSGKKSAAAAQTAGLAPSSISTLLVEGDNRPGLCLRRTISPDQPPDE